MHFMFPVIYAIPRMQLIMLLLNTDNDLGFWAQWNWPLQVEAAEWSGTGMLALKMFSRRSV